MTERPHSLSAEHLSRSLEMFQGAHNPDVLFGAAHRRTDLAEVHAGLLVVFGQRRRVHACLTATLFAAFAAEAYANEFLAATLADRKDDLRAVDRMPTVEKYVLGTEIALGRSLFARGTDPVETIAALFKLRNRLVHPRVGFGPGPGTQPSAEFAAEFAPPQTAKFIVTVAEAASVLMGEAYPEGSPVEWPADVIVSGRDVLMAFAERASGNLPSLGSEPEPDLMQQMINGGSPVVKTTAEGDQATITFRARPRST